MRLKRILMKSLGIAVFPAGTAIWMSALYVLFGSATDSFDPQPFSWGMLALAVAGLLVAAGGVMVIFSAGAKPKESISLKNQAGS